MKKLRQRVAIKLVAKVALITKRLTGVRKIGKAALAIKKLREARRLRG